MIAFAEPRTTQGIYPSVVGNPNLGGIFSRGQDASGCQVDSIKGIHQERIYHRSGKYRLFVMITLADLHGKQIIRFFLDIVSIESMVSASTP
jgi:hypothetical protein